MGINANVRRKFSRGPFLISSNRKAAKLDNGLMLGWTKSKPDYKKTDSCEKYQNHWDSNTSYIFLHAQDNKQQQKFKTMVSDPIYIR